MRAAATTLLVVAVLGVHSLAIRNVILLSTDMIHGDGSASQLIPEVRYQALRLPDTPITRRYDAVNRIAGDFAQVYFPAQEFSLARKAYAEDTLDPWSRPSRYAPFVHWLCAVTLCSLPYGYASILHVGIQYGAFLASFVYAFRVLGLDRYLIVALVWVNAGLFLTPVGLSWFERGQFSLYIALAYLWLLLGLYRNNARFLVLSALFAYLKWTSFPTIFVVLSLWLLSSSNVTALKRQVRLALASVSPLVVLFAVFPEHGMYFLEGIVFQETVLAPDGMSLARLIPRWAVKLLPFALVAVGFFKVQRQEPELARLFPFVLGSAIILLLYPTWAYDYSIPSLFGTIPFAFDWARRPAVRGRFIAWFVLGLFLMFMTAASTATLVVPVADSYLVFVWAYLVCSVIFLALPLEPPRGGTAPGREVSQGVCQ